MLLTVAGDGSDRLWDGNPAKCQRPFADAARRQAYADAARRQFADDIPDLVYPSAPGGDSRPVTPKGGTGGPPDAPQRMARLQFQSSTPLPQQAAPATDTATRGNKTEWRVEAEKPDYRATHLTGTTPTDSGVGRRGYIERPEDSGELLQDTTATVIGREGSEITPVRCLLGASSTDAAPMATATATAAPRPIIKPMTFAGDETSLNEYLAHFDLCATINGWSQAQAGMFLGVSLAGTARRLLEGINPCSETGYRELRRRLRGRFEPENATGAHKAKLRSLERAEGQSLMAFSDEILALVRKAYPTVEPATQEVLAKDRFIEALADSELRLWVLHTQPSSLTRAVAAAIEGETELLKERSRRPRVRAAQGAPQVEDSQISQLVEIVKRVAINQEEFSRRGRGGARGRGRGRGACFRCQEYGHFARECPAPAPTVRQTAEGGVASAPTPTANGASWTSAPQQTATANRAPISNGSQEN